MNISHFFLFVFGGGEVGVLLEGGIKIIIGIKTALVTNVNNLKIGGVKKLFCVRNFKLVKVIVEGSSDFFCGKRG